jgi:hypothetical protein
MDLRGTDLSDDRGVPRRDVADVGAEAVRRVERVHSPHHPVAHDLRHDRRGGDGGALLVAVDDRAVLRRPWTQPEAVDEADLRGWRKLREDGPQAGEVRAMEALAVDLPRRDRADDNPVRATDHGLEERLALCRSALLGVVQARERTHAVVAQPRVVEENTGDEERPRERPPPRLVSACDKARTELAVELEELPAGASCHHARIAPGSAGDDAGHAFVTEALLAMPIGGRGGLAAGAV